MTTNPKRKRVIDTPEIRGRCKCTVDGDTCTRNANGIDGLCRICREEH